MRYTVNISFKTKTLFDKSSNIVEKVKSKREAYDYKDMIDDTVSRAVLIDNISNSVIETWK